MRLGQMRAQLQLELRKARENSEPPATLAAVCCKGRNNAH
jgi:hypothetical protein